MFQYSLCRIVYCCTGMIWNDRRIRECFNIRSVESCTAASLDIETAAMQLTFQYSLCRIVYCCEASGRKAIIETRFQYSLCRIVYCCMVIPDGIIANGRVSIFALSNRVLLLMRIAGRATPYQCFNIRSVESCTAALSPPV